MNKVTAKSYTLRTESGQWLGQIVLTSDGAFMSVTDWGNFSFAWRHTGVDDFRKFLIRIGEDYFAGKMYQGIAYVAYGDKYKKVAERFAEKILPVLKEVLKAELAAEAGEGVSNG